MQKRHNQKRFAQNFLVHGKTVRKLIRLAELDPERLILEIGPGEGIITKELAQTANRVIAIELDPKLAVQLTAEFGQRKNVSIRQGDILKIDLPGEAYDLFSNIPFNITAEIMARFWESKRPPRDSYLIMQKEAAEKFAADTPSTESSILYQPWFWFEILAPIHRFEFRPVPSVDASFLHMHHREKPRLNPKDKPAYARFVKHGFRSWKKSLKIAYKSVFTFPQWKRLAKENRFSVDAIPSDLSLTQWLALYTFYRDGVPAEKKRLPSSFSIE